MLVKLSSGATGFIIWQELPLTCKSRLCAQAVKFLGKLHICADLHEPMQ